MNVKTIKHPATLIAPDNIKLSSNKAVIDALLSRTPETLKTNVLEIVDIGFGGAGNGHKEFTGDAAQAYGQALAYIVTKKDVYAENVMKILWDWSTKCKVFKGNNAPLEAAWGVASMSRACELVKYVYKSKWKKGVETSYITWVRKLLLPHLKGETERYKLNWGFFNNWHTSITEARMQFALLTDDIQEFNWCCTRYKEILSKYVKEDGLTGESFRDSDHCCFGLAGLIQMAELAWHQGINLYTDTLRKSLELHAGVYSGEANPPNWPRESFSVYKWIQPSAWEVAVNHYTNRNKFPMPYTQSLLKKIRPCKYELHWGWDTLTHAAI
jgi:hypothetical protein